jgi:hypothetical protein
MSWQDWQDALDMHLVTRSTARMLYAEGILDPFAIESVSTQWHPRLRQWDIRIDDTDGYLAWRTPGASMPPWWWRDFYYLLQYLGILDYMEDTK